MAYINQKTHNHQRFKIKRRW